MDGPKKPIKSPNGYMVELYKCPYCGDEFTKDEILRHIDICYMFYRKNVKENYKKAAKKRRKDGGYGR